MLARELMHRVPNRRFADVLASTFGSLAHAISLTVIDSGAQGLRINGFDERYGPAKLTRRIAQQVLVPQDYGASTLEPIASFEQVPSIAATSQEGDDLGVLQRFPHQIGELAILAVVFVGMLLERVIGRNEGIVRVA